MGMYILHALNGPSRDARNSHPDFFLSLRVPNPKGIHSGQLNVDFYVTERDHTVGLAEKKIATKFSANVPWNQLISQPFFSEHGSGRPHPHWQFIPAEHK